MVKEDAPLSRRDALRCLAFGSVGTLFMLSGGVLTPVQVDGAELTTAPAAGQPLFVQLSDTHIGFHKDANPDVGGTLTRAINLVNAMPAQPKFLIHTGDITHLSKPAEFDAALCNCLGFGSKNSAIVLGRV